MIFRLNRTKKLKKDPVLSVPYQPASASVFNRVFAQKLEREHFIPLFCTCPDFLDELAQKSLLHRPVTSRKLQSRTVVALFPFSPLQTRHFRFLAKRDLLDVFVGHTFRGLLTQSSYLRPYSSSKVNDFAYCGKCLDLEPTFKIM